MAEGYRILSVLLLLTCPCLGTSIVLQEETFDGYGNGTDLQGVDGWDNNPVFSAVVTQNQSKIAPQAVNIKLDTDLVQEFPVMKRATGPIQGGNIFRPFLPQLAGCWPACVVNRESESRTSSNGV